MRCYVRSRARSRSEETSQLIRPVPYHAPLYLRAVASCAGIRGRCCRAVTSPVHAPLPVHLLPAPLPLILLPLPQSLRRLSDAEVPLRTRYTLIENMCSGGRLSTGVPSSLDASQETGTLLLFQVNTGCPRLGAAVSKAEERVETGTLSRDDGGRSGRPATCRQTQTSNSLHVDALHVT